MEHDALSRVLDSQWLTMGPVTEDFEARFAALVGVPRALACSSCTAALHLALLALGIGPGDEVIVPSLTFVATANAVLYCGATPVFADILGEHDLTLDPADVERRITPATRAIMVMHHSGYPGRLAELGRLARDHGLYLVEDAAHAPAAFLGEQALGTFGDAGCYSFFSNKNMTCAEGGMLVMRDPDRLERARLLRSHGMTTLTWDRHRGHASGYDVVDIGFNYRIDEIRAALGRAQLEQLEAWNRRRRERVSRYRECLAPLHPTVTVPFSDVAGPLAYHLMTIVLETHDVREAVRHALPREGVQVSVHYPPIHEFTAYRMRGPFECLTRTEDVASRLLTLPLHPHLLDEDVEEICRRLVKVLYCSRSEDLRP